MFHADIICIGDIHGDFEVFLKVLEMCKLIDKKKQWIGEDTHVVQLGDTLDGKRPGVVIDKEFITKSGEIEIFNFILELDFQAKKKGGRVISIIGNHELYPYYFKNDANFIKDYVKKTDIDKIKKKYNTNRINFFKPGGIGGSLIGKTRPLILQLGPVLFIHGSITDLLIKENLDEEGFVDVSKINNDTSLWLQGKGKIPKYLEQMNSNNPVFSRDYSSVKDISSNKCKEINEQISYFRDVKYVVMGHSSYKAINTACHGTLIRTDVSLSRAFGGKLEEKNLQALKISFNFTEPLVEIITDRGMLSLT